MTEITGHIGRDREIRTTRWGKSYVLLNLATNSWKGGRQTTTWHRCIAWNAERIEHIGARLARKGDKYQITGEPRVYTYTKDGEEREFRYFEISHARILRRTHAPEWP